MKLIITGNAANELNSTYCRNLCLIFFPGAKFPENQELTEKVPAVKLNIDEIGGNIECKAEIINNGNVYTGAGSVRTADYVSRVRAMKTASGEAMLEAGGKMLGKLPPWGIMTGVRPAKLGRELRARGYHGEDFIRQVIKEFHVSPQKAALLETVTAVEERAAVLAQPDTCSLYISIPFCPTRCAYCSFVSYATPKYMATLPAYLDVLCEDIASMCEKIKEKGKRILTVYIGGGTPTVLDASQLDRLLTTVRKCTDNTDLLEFTVEAGRPDTVTEEKFNVMLSHGVDRTSINPQILNDSVLERIGRKHTVDDFYRAYDIARKSGINSINTDLIAGLPGSDFGIFSGTVDEIIRLSPDNVTVHTYCVKRSADFTADAVLHGDTLGIYSYSGGDTSECVDYAQEKLTDNLYKPYYMYRQKNAQGNLENVGYAKDGKEGLYNIFIMEELQDIYAVGAGAVTKLVGGENSKITRIFEPKYTYEYLNSKKS